MGEGGSQTALSRGEGQEVSLDGETRRGGTGSRAIRGHNHSRKGLAFRGSRPQSPRMGTGHSPRLLQSQCQRPRDCGFPTFSATFAEIGYNHEDFIFENKTQRS